MTKQPGAPNDSGGARYVTSAWIVVAAVLGMLIGISSVQEALQSEEAVHPSVEREHAPVVKPVTMPKGGKYGSV